MIALSASHLYKNFGIDPILQDITFSVSAGERVALVGANGAGKTTLLRILTGQEEADQGDIFLGKDLKLGYMEQLVSCDSQQSVLEEVLSVFAPILQLEKEIRRLELEIAQAGRENDSLRLESLMESYSLKTTQYTQANGYACESEAKGILIGLGFSQEQLTRTVAVLSGGEQTRLRLAQLLLQKPDLLLLDEPTNHLDTQSVQWLESYLRQYKGTLLIVSHDRYFLDQLTTRTFEIFRHRLRVYPGNYSAYVQQRAAAFEIEQRAYIQNQAEMARQQEVIDKLRSFGREKQIKRARSREKLLEKMDVVEKPQLDRDPSSIHFEPSLRSGRDVLEAKGLYKRYRDKTLFQDLYLRLYRGEKVALMGPNGCGKSTLFSILLGKLPADDGTVTLGSGVRPAYFDQTRQDLSAQKTIFSEIHDAFPSLSQTQVRTYLANMRFVGEEVFKTIDSLSGGEKSRVSLLKLMLSDANLLFLDEPTNHLDIESREVLEDALRSYQGTLLVISHDRYFLNQVPGRIYRFESQELVCYEGNYDYMVEKTLERHELSQAQEDISVNKTAQRAQKKKNKDKDLEERKNKRRIAEIESRIGQIEAQLQAVEQKLCQEQVYTNHQKLQGVLLEKKSLTQEMDALFEEWEILTIE